MATFSNTSDSRIDMIYDLLTKSVNTEILKETIMGYTIALLSDLSPLKKSNINVDIGDLLMEIDDKSIDNYGEIFVSANLTKINLIDYIERLKPDVKYKIKSYNFKTNTIQISEIAFPILNNFGIKKIYIGFDKLDYINLNGLIITPLTINAVKSYTKLAHSLKKYNAYTQQFTPRLVVANVSTNSPFNIIENISQGDVINTINNIKVHTLDDLKKIIVQECKYITICTTNHKIDTICLNTYEKLNV
jgi:hypothetical protein